MELAHFEKLVEESIGQLPVWVREKIENVAILIEDEPSDEIRKMEGLEREETLLGLYQGIPLTEREVGMESLKLPDTITLYKKPIEEAAREDGMDVRDVVADTVWHEFAHHFGMDEGQVRQRESGRGRH